MASSSGFQIEDQTDEDFFDKLADDEVDGSESKFDEISKHLSNLSLGDGTGVNEFSEKVENSEIDENLMQNESEIAEKVENSEKGENLNQNEDLSNVIIGGEFGITENSEKVDILKPNEASENHLLVSDENFPNFPFETSSSFDSDKIKSDGSKGTSVREVQWSAFSADGSQEFENIASFVPYSDFLVENFDGGFKNIENFSSNVGNTEQQDTQFNGCGNVEPTVDQNDPSYWENLYPGWKYDANAGQWYQIENYGATSNALLDGSNVSSVQSVSENSNVSYLQQTSESVLETIAEESTVSSTYNWNDASQGNVEYPPNMVFDPQYPEWYYDTNTQQWYTLESYNSSNAVQDQLPQDMNASITSINSELNQSLYTTNDGQYEQHGVQSGNHDQQNNLYNNISLSAQLASQNQTWDASMSNSLYNDTSQSELANNQSWGSQDYGQNWNASMDNSNGHHSGQNQGSQGSGQNSNATVSNYAQQNSLYSNFNQFKLQNNQRNMWQPQPLSGSAHNSSFPVSQTTHQNNLYSNMSQPMEQTNYFQGSQGFAGNQDVSRSAFVPQNMWKPQPMDINTHATSTKTREPAVEQNFRNASMSTFVPQKNWKPHPADSNARTTNVNIFEPVKKQNYGNNNVITGFQSFTPAESNFKFNQPMVEQTLQAHLSDSYYGDQNMSVYPEQSFHSANASQYSYAPSEGRSSAGRPPHALVSFGFGGKLIVMKNFNSIGANLDFGNQENTSNVITVLSLSEVVKDKDDSYFQALCLPSFPGPLVGGNAAAKDVNKWIDDKIVNCDPASMDYRKIEFLKLLFSLLKILCQHYGKLRSPFGADLSLEDIDGPESAVTKLFASAKNNKSHLTQFGSLTHCMQNLPSEGQIRATAIEVQNLLVSGRRKDALQYAQEGQLWGPALVLASQLGEKFYIDTVKKMAQIQFVSGSPLRTLCLLIAGQPADVFSIDSSGVQDGPHGSTQAPANGMLDDWEENLAIITANRTKDDELVIIHLGDCLLKERREIIAAHTCYLVAESNFESYSDSARICLIAADHWKSPRTYASPEAIQRTEVYEYSKVLGNSQFVLVPFQPYKLIYAYMLAEVGKVSESLKYCQASLKLLKNSGRAPEVEMLKTSLSSLEERLRTHQQGGYSSNLAPGKLVNKLFTSIDRSIHRMIGTPPGPLPPMPPSSGNNSKDNFSMGPRGAGSQSTMAMSSLVPSASVDAMSDWAGDGNRKSMHNRSISEPDFGRQGSPDGQSKSSGTPSRFGRIGSQLFQKTIGWVSRSRSDRQAKLGESNKFYYDEKLKRWVEEGAETPVVENALPPPPTTAVFQNGGSDYNINSAFKDQSPPASNGGPETNSPVPLDSNSGMPPPIPPTQNQFSARGRMGVRSRYVDTFNKGNSSNGSRKLTNSFQSPTTPSIKPSINTKFFVPASPTPSNEQIIDSIKETVQEPATNSEPSTSLSKEMEFSPPSMTSSSPPPSSLQRFPSMDNITPSANTANGSLSRTRAASWSGTIPNGVTSNRVTRFAGSPPFLPQNPPSTRSSSSSSLQLNGGQIGEELHEVEL